MIWDWFEGLGGVDEEGKVQEGLGGRAKGINTSVPARLVVYRHG